MKRNQGEETTLSLGGENSSNKRRKLLVQERIYKERPSNAKSGSGHELSHYKSIVKNMGTTHKPYQIQFFEEKSLVLRGLFQLS